jgi:DNA replication and repair protein RecF
VLSTLDSWDEQLAAAGSELMAMRRSYVERLSALAGETHREISDGREQLEIRYLPSVTMGDDMQSNLEALFGARENDLKRMTTSVGAHRDDVLLTIAGRDVRAYGSQGQQRTAALAMRLSELHVMRESMGEWPMLMLDDVMSELDSSRQDFILNKFCGRQIFITCCDPASVLRLHQGKSFYIEKGDIVEQQKK